MSAIKLEQFGGMLPAWDAHLLPTGQAAFSKNGYLFGGNLTGWRAPKQLRALQGSTRAAFRIPTVQQAQAQVYFVFVSLPANGDQVTVGDLTYTFKLTGLGSGDGGALAQNEILLGTIDECARNLSQAVTADGGTNLNAGTNYGDDTVANGDVYFTPADGTPPVGMSDPSFGTVTIGATTYNYTAVGAFAFGAAYNNVQATVNAGGRVLALYDVQSLAHTTTTFRGGSNPFFDSSITSNSIWMEFADPDTNVVKSPVAGDEWNRFYWASPSDMPKYNTYDRIKNGDHEWLLGIPPPGCAPILSVVGGGNTMTLGNFTLGGGEVFIPANTLYLVPVFTTGDTSLVDVQFRLSGVNGVSDLNSSVTTNWAAVVYNDDGSSGDETIPGKPGTLLNTTPVQKGVTNDVPNIATFTNPTGLNGNKVYWIGILLDRDNYFESGPAGGGSTSAFFPCVFTNGPPGVAPTAKAFTDLTSDGTNVNDGDTVTIGFTNYVFQTVLTNVPGHVQIGLTAALSLQNLLDAVNLTGTPGTQYAAATTKNTLAEAVSITATSIHFDARLQSTAGSAIASVFTPSSTAHLSFPGGAPTFFNAATTDQTGINLWGDFQTSDIIESRSYVYTWVSEYGEEGPPSPPTILDGWSNGVWTIGLWQPPPDDMGILRNLKKIRLYRTVSGQNSADFFFVDDFTIAAMSDDTMTFSPKAADYSITTPNVGNGVYVDSAKNSLVALNELIPSGNWFPPPANLQGITVMQNGMLAGFVGNEIWFCDPYHPWAWPPDFMQTSDYTIVGLGVTGGSLVACTSSNPYVLSGASPGNITMTKCSQPNPCLSRGSIIGSDKAVAYMSRNGLISVDPSGTATNTTDLWFTRDKWQQLTPQQYTRAIYLASQYLCFGTQSPPSVSPADNSVAQQGFSIEIDNDVQSFTIWPQPGGHRLGFQSMDSPTGADMQNVMTDVWSGSGMAISNGYVWYWDFADLAPTIRPYRWRSKVYQQNVKRNYSAVKVFFTIPPGVTAPVTRNTAVASDPSWNTLRSDQYGILRTFVDVDGSGSLTLIDAREITRSGELLRIVDGFKAEQWQWEIEGRVNVSNVQIATSPKELGSV